MNDLAPEVPTCGNALRLLLELGRQLGQEIEALDDLMAPTFYNATPEHRFACHRCGVWAYESQLLEGGRCPMCRALI